MTLRWIAPVLLSVAALCLAPTPSLAVSARVAFDTANLGLNGGDGFKNHDNSNGTLAWGESYIMMSLVEMYRATGEPTYLVTLADHADSVLASRDDVLGLVDFAGKSGPCWQNTKYQPDAQPYCYVVHSGMLTFPMVDFATVVYADPGLHEVTTVDGATLLAKADDYVSAAAETIAHHDFQWQNGPGSAEGHYVGDPAAVSFLPNIGGVELPINQMMALGRTLVALWETTGEVSYLDQALRLARRFEGQLTLAPGEDAWVWNYWGGAYAPPGEDISHGAIEIDFAVLAHDAGLVFGDQDMERFGTTFFDKVYKDEDTLADNVGGTGGVNGSSYSPQIARWLDLTRWRPAIQAIVRNRFDQLGTSTGSGSVLLGWALLARYEARRVGHSFYWADWEDHGAYQKATAFGANLLVAPPTPFERVMTPVKYRAATALTLQQWDGAAYHDVARWPGTDGAWRTLLLAYDPDIWFPYAQGKVLYQLADAAAAGDGVEVAYSQPGSTPEVQAPAELAAHVGEQVVVALEATGDQPIVWSIDSGPAGAWVEPMSGQLTWVVDGDEGELVALGVRAENDWGASAGTVVVHVLSSDADGDGSPWDEDCDDDDPHRAPGLSEGCDGVDNDCDGQTDEVCAAVSGLVFLDLDANGAHDAGEPGVAGLQVWLRHPPLARVSRVTGPDGTFDFGALRPGHLMVYTRAETSEGLFATTAPAVGFEAMAGQSLMVSFGFAPP